MRTLCCVLCAVCCAVCRCAVCGVCGTVRCAAWVGVWLHSYCLFNLTADASESFDLANDTSLVPQVNHMLRRLQYHGNRAPPPAYLWTEAEFETAAAQICKQALERPGRTLQPIDAA